MAYAAGVDVGSTQTKAVIIDEDRNIISRALIDTGANVVLAAENAYKKALANDGATEGLRAGHLRGEAKVLSEP